MGAHQDANGNWIDDVTGLAAAAPTGGLVPPAIARPAPALVPVLSTRPEHETTVISEQKTASPQSDEARRKAMLAEGELANQREALTDVTAEQLGGDARAARAEVEALEQQKKDAEARKARQAEDRAKHVGEVQAAAAAEADAKRKAGAADADFWKGNAPGEVATAIFRAIQEGIQSYKGQSGPTGAERIAQARMNAHEKKLVGEWEALGETRRLKKENLDAWETERARIEAQAAKESLAEIQIIRSKATAFAKNLDPAKQRKLDGVAQAVETLANRHLEQKAASEFDRTQRTSVTNRSPAGGVTGAPGKLTSSQEDAAADLNTAAGLIESYAKAPALSKGAIEKFNNNQEALSATANPQGVWGATKNRLGRAAGLIPKGPFEGIGQAEREQLTRVDKLRTIQQKLMTGAGVTQAEMATYRDQFGINFGDSAESVRSKMVGLASTLRERAVKAGPAGPAAVERIDNVLGTLNGAGGKGAPQGELGTFKDAKGRTFKGRKLPNGDVEEVD